MGGGEGGTSTEMQDDFTPNDSSHAGLGSVDVTSTVTLAAVCGIVTSMFWRISPDQDALP
jgi:hypothetical protein